jgi:hypothetical protein
MTRDEFHMAGQYFLDAHGVRNFKAYEVAPVGRLANGKGPALGAPPPDVMRNALILVEEVLEWVREVDGVAPIHVSSWYRDPAYNAAVGGVSASIHLTGGASDIGKAGLAPKALARLIHFRHPASQRLGIGCYATFVHVDVRGFLGRPAPARWGPVGAWWTP